MFHDECTATVAARTQCMVDPGKPQTGIPNVQVGTTGQSTAEERRRQHAGRRIQQQRRRGHRLTVQHDDVARSLDAEHDRDAVLFAELQVREPRDGVVVDVAAKLLLDEAAQAWHVLCRDCAPLARAAVTDVHRR